MAAANKQKSWQDFVEWCTAHGLSYAPAHAWTLAAYTLNLERQMRPEKIRRTVQHIGQMHFEKLRKRPDRHPIVMRTLESIRARDDAAKRPAPPPLFRPDDFLGAATKVAKPVRGKNATATRPSDDTAKRGLRGTPKLVRRKRLKK